MVDKRIRFSDADAMAIVWYGRYPKLFEMAAEALSGKIGLTYKAYFESGLRAPVVQMHIDYYAPLELETTASVTARLIWTEAARLNTEYTVIRKDGVVAATGYTVQMFVEGKNGTPYYFTPPLVKKMRRKWLNGDFDSLT